MPQKQPRKTEADPVLALARRLRKTRLMAEFLDGCFDIESAREDGTPMEDCQAFHALYHVFDESAALVAMISQERATTPQGAAVQLATALEVMDQWGEIGFDNGEPDDGQEWGSHPRQIYRLLTSALAAIEQAIGCEVGDLVTPDYGSPGRSPWELRDRYDNMFKREET